MHKTGIRLCHDGTPLHGTVRLDGAKHSLAHVLAGAAVHNRGQLTNVANNIDSDALIEGLRQIFTEVVFDARTGRLRFDTPRRSGTVRFKSELLARSRSLFCLVPAALHHVGQVILDGQPSGCDIGARPSGWYQDALERFGVRSERVGTSTRYEWEDRHPAKIEFKYPSMTGSVMALAMASTLQDPSDLTGLSVEPSFEEQIEAAEQTGTYVCRSADGSRLRVARGEASSTNWAIGADRIHAVTLLTAGLLTYGDVTVTFGRDLRIPRFIKFCERLGCDVEGDAHSLRVAHPLTRPLASVSDFKVGSEPLFSSDWAPFAALLLATRANGTSSIVDDVFVGRFQFTGLLSEAGLNNVTVKRQQIGGREAAYAKIVGNQRLQLRSTRIERCPDIRGSAAIVLASLIADGPITLVDDFHLRRGYRNLPDQLAQLGLKKYETLEGPVH
ncbi:MAG: hypothetical protein J0I04_00185 [Paenarthrobacter ureafaciens]|uniref:hypothetical protein n=1 Tax=Paenarthrobacter ureafaciens TaxID=37931 RepID=UPI001ACCCF65|nr:hypothetical protein [Paenarthrobacter ureafaciens]MBN9128061.1 hypothetical protein [Paenarthrobacter ureafaciens]